jgi:hypothetical protein
MVVAPVPIQMLEIILLANVNNLLNTYNSACEKFAFYLFAWQRIKAKPILWCLGFDRVFRVSAMLKVIEDQ